MVTEESLEQLEKIRLENGGVLRPRDVVDTARDKKSPLHDYFTWDDSHAAELYRLEQARVIIRCAVTIIPNKNEGVTVRAYTSLYDDRKVEGGGYRLTVDILSDEDRRTALVRQALSEARAWEEKYKTLRELIPVFSAMKKVREKAKIRMESAGQYATL